MSKFFPAVETAITALAHDFRLRPYYDPVFQLNGIISIFAHVLRTLYNLLTTVFRIVVTPLFLLNPLCWPLLPEHGAHLVDNVGALLISAITVGVQIIDFPIRTLMSVCIGYEANTFPDKYAEDESDFESDLEKALTILPTYDA